MSTDRWKNRIVGQGEIAPDQLLANPLNWRRHPPHQQAAMQAALTDLGWIQQVIVNQRSGQMIDGHLRVMLALRQGEPSIPVLYVDLSEREENLALATLDPISTLAEPDEAKLAELLADVTTGEAALQELLAKMGEDLADEARSDLGNMPGAGSSTQDPNLVTCPKCGCTFDRKTT